MGRKLRGALKRSKKRGDALQQELVHESVEHAKTARITEKPNEELFVLDTTAAPLTKLDKPKTPKPKSLSEKDQIQVKKLLKRHDAKQLQQLASKQKKKQKQEASFDLWDTTTTTANSNKTNTQVESSGIGSCLAGTAPSFVKAKSAIGKKKTPKVAVAVDVAHGGQSYHPDFHQHQDVIGEALALELRRKEAFEYKKTPLSQGLDPTTRALLIDSDSESSSDEDEEEVPILKKKTKEKLTRTQRNRQKRVRAQEAELQQRKRLKQQEQKLTEIKKFTKELNTLERKQQEQKELLKELQEQPKRILGTRVIQEASKHNPMHAPSLPVALSEELSSSAMRTIRPKGNLVMDRMDSFMDRKMAVRKKQNAKRIVQGKKRKVRNKDVAHLLQG